MRKLVFFALLFVIVFANPTRQVIGQEEWVWEDEWEEEWEDWAEWDFSEDGSYWEDEDYSWSYEEGEWSLSDPNQTYGGDDFDNDTIRDDIDNCPMVPISSQNDLDRDGIGDVCDPKEDADEDNDGVPDSTDSCPRDTANDADGDGICESDDICPTVADINQSDVDGDGTGDACEPDNEGDGVVDDVDNCPLDPNTGQADADGDGIGDVCDADDDNDGVLGDSDVCLGTQPSEPVLANGCSIDQQCECNTPWKNHGAYVSCVAHASNALLNAGQITQAEKDAMMAAAGETSCGQKK